MTPFPPPARSLLLVAACLALPAMAAEHHGRQFVGLEDFSRWTRSPGPATNGYVLTSPPLPAGLAWNQLVLSWNALTPPGTGLKFEARPAPASSGARFYTLGLWCSEPSAEQPRESVPDQKDDRAEVRTDTLVLRQPATAVEVRVSFDGAPDGAQPRVSFLGLSFLDSRVVPPVLAPNRAAWGRELGVPERTQVIYPEGRTAWCSPTSISMILAFWSERLRRPELELEVPAVAKAVHDPRWPGTGNWPFNTAFAGTFPGLRAFVTRLADVSELEDWIASGVPVAVSVSYNLLRGQPRDRSDGHLVVVRGFTGNGSVIVNDPGTSRGIRRVFPRADLVKAWAVSHNTVYLVHPARHRLPVDRFGHW